MAGATAVALLGLVLEDLDLLATKVLGDSGLDLDLLEILGPQHDVITPEHDGLQRDFVTLLRLQAIHNENRAFFDPVLLATALYNRIHN